MAYSKNKDLGLNRALSGGAASPHPYARSVVGGFERYEALSNDEEELTEWQRGDIPIGFMGDAEKIAFLNVSDIQKHVLIIGPTGVGKTNLARIIADGLMRRGIKLMIFDLTGDHVGLYNEFNPLVFPVKHLRLNPAEPPAGVPHQAWLEIFSPIFILSQMLTNVSRGTLVQLVRHSNEYFEMAEKGLSSSIYEQRVAIDELRPRSYRDSARMAYWSRLEDRYDALLTSVSGDIFACYRGHSIEYLLERNIIFDCMGVSSQVLRIVIPILLAKIYSYRQYNRGKNHKTHGIILEESENIFRQVRGGGFLENPLDDMVRRIRRSQFLIVLNQTITTLSTSLRSNVHVRIMLGATNPAERTEMGRAIGLRDEQWEQALLLTTPNAFVSVGGRTPQLISIPEYKMPKERHATNLISSPDQLPFIPVSESLKKDIYKVIFNKKRIAFRRLQNKGTTQRNDKIIELLSDIAKNPFVKFTERKSLSFASSRENMFKTLNAAKEMKLVRQVYVKTTRGRGQRGLYLELTAKAIDMLVDRGLLKDRKPYYSGKMGFLGALILNRIIRPFYEELGYKAILEGIDKGADCDLGLLNEKGNKAIACELSVTTNAEHELTNIRRNFQNGWQKTICIVIGVRSNDDLIEEDDSLTQKKLSDFKEYFKRHLLASEQQRVELKDIKFYRKERLNGI